MSNSTGPTSDATRHPSPLDPDRAAIERPWWRTLLALFSHRAFLPILLALYALGQGIYLADTLRDPRQRAQFVVKDSRQYYEIARDFAEGDFSFSYVRPRPHRQPLYSLALAPAVAIFGENPAALGATNILIGIGIVLLVHMAILGLFRDPIIAGLAAIAAATSRFLREEITGRIMTEPLHVLVMVGMIWLFVLYLRHRKARFLLGASAGVALDYLTRTNGLFIAAAFFATAGWADLLAARSGPGLLVLPDPRAIVRLIPRYAAAAALFVLVSAPSWVPRIHYHHNPIDHGYLTNFFWADNYDEAHDDDRLLSFHHYASRHDIDDAARRMLSGAAEVYATIPIDMEPSYRRALYLLAALGAALALALGPREFRYLLLFTFIQMLPLAWTRVANPSERVPYGALLPFEFFFAALALAHLASRFLPLLARRPASENPAPADP